MEIVCSDNNPTLCLYSKSFLVEQIKFHRQMADKLEALYRWSFTSWYLSLGRIIKMIKKILSKGTAGMAKEVNQCRLLLHRMLYHQQQLFLPLLSMNMIFCHLLSEQFLPCSSSLLWLNQGPFGSLGRLQPDLWGNALVLLQGDSTSGLCMSIISSPKIGDMLWTWEFRYSLDPSP